MGWNATEVRDIVLVSPPAQMFRQMLFMRMVPNLKKLGLLTPRVREAFERLGILQFEDADPEAQDRALGPGLTARIAHERSRRRRASSGRSRHRAAPPRRIRQHAARRGRRCASRLNATGWARRLEPELQALVPVRSRSG